MTDNGSVYVQKEHAMGVQLSELEPGDEIVLQISSEDKKMDMTAVIVKNIRSNISFISLKDQHSQKLNFENVRVAVEYCQEEKKPIRWKAAQVTAYGSGYVLQVQGEGMPYNRRESFRVGVSKPARMRRDGARDSKVMVRDISATGFAISDQKKELLLNNGDELTILLEDLGYELTIRGRVVRKEENEQMLIYGLTILNIPANLDEYLAVKQRRNRSS